MAFQMNYTDSTTGAQYPQSYWLPMNINLNKQSKQGVVTFFGFVDAQARQQNKQKIASKSYRITADSYDLLFGADAQNPEGKNPFSAAYTLALATMEGPPPAQGEADGRTSFFVDSQNV